MLDVDALPGQARVVGLQDDPLHQPHRAVRVDGEAAAAVERDGALALLDAAVDGAPTRAAVRGAEHGAVVADGHHRARVGEGDRVQVGRAAGAHDLALGSLGDGAPSRAAAARGGPVGIAGAAAGRDADEAEERGRAAPFPVSLLRASRAFPLARDVPGCPGRDSARLPPAARVASKALQDTRVHAPPAGGAPFRPHGRTDRAPRRTRPGARRCIESGP